MSEHTPGPWVTKLAIETHYGEGDYGIIADGKLIAEAYGIVGPMEYAPSAANARLIAAAPDLLAACEAVMQWTDVETTWDRVYPLVKAAIRAARGGSDD